MSAFDSAKIDHLKEIVFHQSHLESLWMLKPTIAEALLMAALRHLHAFIEGDTHAAEAAKSIYWNVESEM